MSFLSITGLNHSSAPVEIRERLSLTGQERDKALTLLKEELELDEIVIISTCNRTEFLYSCQQENGEGKVLNFLKKEKSLNDDEYEQFFYHLNGLEAYNHLLRVASGLNSLVVGESQILGQVKDAFELSAEAGFTDRNFHKIYQKMLQCAKAVHRETEINRGSLSISFVAVQLARNIYESLEDKTVLLIGAGEMCELAGIHFQDAGVKAINVINRSFDNAEKLAARFNGKAYRLQDQLTEALINADIILSCTGAPSYVLTEEQVRIAHKKRPRRSFFLIDIAVPRDIEESVNEINDVYLYNIDDMKKITESNKESRNAALNNAEAVVEDYLELFRTSQATAELGPIIHSLKTQIAEISNTELEKLFRRNNHFSDEDRQQIKRMTELITNKITHDPIISLRKKAHKKQGITEIFKDFFNL